jgi:hypothetical protein
MSGLKAFFFYRVAIEKRRMAAFALNGFHSSLAAFFIATQDGDLRAGFGEAFSEGTTERAGGANHNRYFSRQIE